MGPLTCHLRWTAILEQLVWVENSSHVTTWVKPLPAIQKRPKHQPERRNWELVCGHHLLSHSFIRGRLANCLKFLPVVDSIGITCEIDCQWGLLPKWTAWINTIQPWCSFYLTVCSTTMWPQCSFRAAIRTDKFHVADSWIKIRHSFCSLFLLTGRFSTANISSP